MERVRYDKHPDYPELRGIVGEAATRGQIVEYPKIVRTNTDDPIPNQVFGIVVLNLFDEPFVKDGRKIYGFAKLRGNYVDVETCKRFACKIVKEQDSASINRIVSVGQWFPVTNDTLLSHEVIEVAGEGEMQIKKNIDEEKRKEHVRLEKEIREREDQCKMHDVYDNRESDEYYAMRRVTHLKLFEDIQNRENKLSEMREKKDQVLKELYELDGKFPQYKDIWVDIYNKERRKAGIPDFLVPPDVDQDYNNYSSSSSSSSSSSISSSSSSSS